MKSGTGRYAFSRRLRTQLMMVFLATIIMLVGAVSVLSYNRSKQVISEQSADLMQQYMEQNQHSIKLYTEEVERLLWLLRVQDSLQSYMHVGWGSNQTIMQAKEIFDYSNTMLSNYDYLDSIYYFGNDGTALGVTKKKNMVTKEPNPNLDWYQLGIQEEVLENQGRVLWYGGFTNQDFTLEKNEEEEVYHYITAVGTTWIGTGRYVSVVVNIKQSELASRVALADKSGEMESYLMNEDGTIVVHQDEARVGTQSEFTLKELENSGESYRMGDDIQINYSNVEDLPWTIVTEITKASLYENLSLLQQWFGILAVGGVLVALVLFSYILNRMTAPLEQLRAAMGEMETGSLGIQLDESSRNELGLLGREFNRMSRSINTMVTQIRDMEEEKRILEKEALQGQLNPHFLFNTLSNMRFMAKLGREEELETCFGALGRMLRPMYRSEGELWSLSQELDYMSNYITIMNCRFSGNLSMEFEIPEYLLELQVLKFILQPLVENAVEHGFAGTQGPGIIVMGAEQQGNQLELYVEDNGNGIREEEQERLRRMLKQAESQKELYRDHVGVVNVHRRLKVHFGNDYGIQIESVPGESTCIYLTMPVLPPE